MTNIQLLFIEAFMIEHGYTEMVYDRERQEIFAFCKSIPDAELVSWWLVEGHFNFN